MNIRGVNNISKTNMYMGERGSARTDQAGMGVKSSNSQMEERRYTEEELIKSIESANEQFVMFDRRFEFSIHEKTKHIMVKVIDVTTDEIIREIPPEKILDLVAGIWEMSGILVDERI